MSEGEEGLNAVKVLAFIGVCFLFFDAIGYFFAYTAGTELMLLYGILEFIFAIFIFLALKFWKFIADLIKVSLPFNWWILLIFGVVTIIFGLLPNASQGSYFTGTILVMAALIDMFGEKKGWKASKMMVLLGAAFAVFDCIVLIVGLANIPAALLELALALMGWSTTQLILNVVFGLIVAVILIILIFDFVDIKIPLEWWVVLAIGFAFFWWIGPMALYIQALLTGAGTTIVLANFSGLILLIGFILMVFGF